MTIWAVPLIGLIIINFASLFSLMLLFWFAKKVRFTGQSRLGIDNNISGRIVKLCLTKRYDAQEATEM